MMKTAEYWLARDEGHRHGFLGKPALPNPPEGYAQGYQAGRLRYDALLDGWDFGDKDFQFGGWINNPAKA